MVTHSCHKEKLDKKLISYQSQQTAYHYKAIRNGALAPAERPQSYGEVLDHSLEALPATLGEPLRLRIFDGLSTKEAAERLGITAAAC